MTEKVYQQGRSGWIFLTHGNNKVIDVFQGLHPNTRWLDHWVSLLSSRYNYFEARNIQYLHVNAPEKLSIYGCYLDTPKNFSINNSPTLQLLSAVDKKPYFVNPIFYLREQSAKRKVYHKTDTHWNFWGAFGAYQLVMSRLGLEQNADILKRPMRQARCVMDLGGKLEKPVKEEVYFHRHPDYIKRVWANKLVEFKEKNNLENSAGLHVGSSVEYKNPNALHKKRVLLFGDSFSEYRPHLLTGILAETFDTVKFVWGLNVDFGIVEDFKPDIVISQSAERFLPFQLPNDDVCYDSFSLKRIESYCSENLKG